MEAFLALDMDGTYLKHNVHVRKKHHTNNNNACFRRKHIRQIRHLTGKGVKESL